jgi:hypothetical protein
VFSEGTHSQKNAKIKKAAPAAREKCLLSTIETRPVDLRGARGAGRPATCNLSVVAQDVFPVSIASHPLVDTNAHSCFQAVVLQHVLACRPPLRGLVARKIMRQTSHPAQHHPRSGKGTNVGTCSRQAYALNVWALMNR